MALVPELRVMTGWLDLVLARAAELRQAGVLAVTDNAGLSVTLAPWSAPSAAAPTAGDPVAVEKPRPAALHDPDSYPDGFMPGFVIDPLEQE